jgi:hypothetical protein
MKRILTTLLLLSLCAAPAFAAKFDFAIPANFSDSDLKDMV